MPEAGYTSREAALVSGVPFFTVDYWDRSKFLRPSIALSAGRGRGRGRRYSYTDALRLRIARTLREQQVSVQTLRHVIKRLEQAGDGLAEARYVYVGRRVELAPSFEELVRLLRGQGGCLGFVLGLEEIQRTVAQRAAKLRGKRAPAGKKLARD